jgi:hypothetical protein
MKRYIIFAAMGFELVALILGCFFLGEYLDKTYQSKGLIFVGLSFLALIGWMVRIIWLVRRFQKLEDEDQGSK